MKKSILIVDNSIDITGALNAILGFSKYAQLQFNFIYVLPKGSKAVEKVKEEGIEVLELPFIEISKNFRSLFLYLPYLCYNAYRLRMFVKQNNIELVHVNDFYNLVGVVAKVLGGQFRLVTHVRFMPNRFPSILVKLWMKLNLIYAETVICVSQAVRQCLPQHAKIQVIYDRLSGIPENRRKIQKENNDINLLYLAHYIPGKGQDFALEAFYKAYQQVTNVRLKFVGGDMGLKKNKVFKNRLMARAQDLKLKDVVEFGGSTANIAKEMQFADIMLNFSESESFSMTCLEALACGTPLIATDCGGPAELFIHKESGWLVSNLDINSMADAIILLVQHEKLREKFSAKGVDYVSKKFTTTNTYDRLTKVYSNVLSIKKNAKT